VERHPHPAFQMKAPGLSHRPVRTCDLPCFSGHIPKNGVGRSMWLRVCYGVQAGKVAS
jgi:hypothetical protein